MKQVISKEKLGLVVDTAIHDNSIIGVKDKQQNKYLILNRRCGKGREWVLCEKTDLIPCKNASYAGSKIRTLVTFVIEKLEWGVFLFTTNNELLTWLSED